MDETMHTALLCVMEVAQYFKEVSNKIQNNSIYSNNRTTTNPERDNEPETPNEVPISWVT